MKAGYRQAQKRILRENNKNKTPKLKKKQTSWVELQQANATHTQGPKSLGNKA
jgi:hypothetical protein